VIVDRLPIPDGSAVSRLVCEHWARQQEQGQREQRSVRPFHSAPLHAQSSQQRCSLALHVRYRVILRASSVAKVLLKIACTVPLLHLRSVVVLMPMNPSPLMSLRSRLRSARYVASLAFLAIACHTGTALPPQSLDSPGGKLFNGYVKADVKCFSCHNGDGTGANGPNLAERVPKLSDEAILKAIDEGPSYMPSFKDKLTANEKRGIIAWLRERFKAQ
jgi:mono/diheme cytochrome c family protein